MKTSGVGRPTDAAELDAIEMRLTQWQIDHALDAPVPQRTPLQRYADAAFRLASTLGLVVQDNGGGLFNSVWSSAVDALNAAERAVPQRRPRRGRRESAEGALAR